MRQTMMQDNLHDIMNLLPEAIRNPIGNGSAAVHVVRNTGPQSEQQIGISDNAQDAYSCLARAWGDGGAADGGS